MSSGSLHSREEIPSINDKLTDKQEKSQADKCSQEINTGWRDLEGGLL